MRHSMRETPYGPPYGLSTTNELFELKTRVN